MCSIPDRVTAPCCHWQRSGNIGRKSVSRLLEDFSQRGLIRIVSNPITTIMDMVCVKSWMMDGRLTENPTYQQTVKAYEGVRIYLFNGQRLETLRKSSTKAKKVQGQEKSAKHRNLTSPYRRIRKRWQSWSAQWKNRKIRRWLMPTMRPYGRITISQRHRAKELYPMVIPLYGIGGNYGKNEVFIGGVF